MIRSGSRGMGKCLMASRSSLKSYPVTTEPYALTCRHNMIISHTRSLQRAFFSRSLITKLKIMTIRSRAPQMICRKAVGIHVYILSRLLTI